MPLSVLAGPKRSGKTGRIFKEIKKNPENSYLIVPEQNLFFYENKILETLGERAAFLCRTLSFLKLSLRVMEEQENYSELKLLDLETANMILASVILENRGLLKLYKGGDKSDYRERIKSQIAELKKHLISLEDILSLKEDKNLPESLKNKLSDIGIVMSCYEKRCEDVFSDSDGLMCEAAEVILSSLAFKNKNVYIDGFTGFTGEELKLISAMDKAGANILISLDYTEEYGKKTGDIYSSVNITLNKLKKLFDEIKIITLSGCDIENPEIKHLCENMFTREEKYEKEPSSVFLYKYKNPSSEISACAADIAKKISEGASPSEFQVVAGNEFYAEKVGKALKEFQIPFYTERKKSVSELPLYALLDCVFDLVLSKPTLDLAANYIKSFCFIKNENIYHFENFIYSSGLKGWQIMSQKGMGYLKENAWNFDYSKEKEITEVYESVILPLAKLKESLRKCDNAEDFSKLIYAFFEEIDLINVMTSVAEEFEKDGDRISAVQYIQVYNAFTEILERCAIILKNERLSFKDYKNILFENLSEKNISTLPLELESVYICDITSVAPGVFSYVYLLNADDSLTEASSLEGFINESDRQILRERDIELSLSPEAKKTEELLKIFTLLTSAEKELYISYPSFNSKGEEAMPSEVIYRLKSIFPHLINKRDAKKIYTEKSLLLEAVSEIGTDRENEGAKKIRQLMESESYGKKVNEVLRYIKLPAYSEVRISGVNEYLNDELKLSVTALEKYRSCGFSYYIKYILKGREKDIFSVDNAGIGLLSHMVAERFSKQVKKEGKRFSEIDEGYIDSRLDKIVEKSVAEVNAGLFETGGRASYMVKKVKRDAKRSLMLICEHFKKGEFVEKAFELSFGREGDELSGMTIELSKNRKIILSGTIDRVDTLSAEDGEYIRVVDYKSTAKTLDLYEIYYGLNIQLITYLMVVLKSDIDKKLLPGGVMYLSLENPMISVKNSENLSGVEAKIRKKLIMKGMFLNNPGVMSAMDKVLLSDGKSEIIEIELDKNNEISKGNALTLDEFELVFEKLKNNIKEMAEGIYKGEFRIRPVSNNGKVKCEYCPYSPICCFDENVFAFEEIKKESFDKVLEKLKEAE